MSTTIDLAGMSAQEIGALNKLATRLVARRTKKSGTKTGLDQFFTPPSLAKRIVQWADPKPGETWIEPSCGNGRLLTQIARAVGVEGEAIGYEIDREVASAAAIANAGYRQMVIHVGDFMALEIKERADGVVMNSPYSDNRDLTHLLKALQVGRHVVALVRSTFEFGQARYQRLFRHAVITRRAVLVRRPPFDGPDDEGHTARHDYVVLDLRRRQAGDSPTHKVETEYWPEAWGDA